MLTRVFALCFTLIALDAFQNLRLIVAIRVATRVAFARSLRFSAAI